MMNTVKKTACALAVLATTSTAVMAESIDVKVIGTITPTACKPTLGGGGTIDYGVIPPASLKKDTFTVLDERQVDFSVTCDAPAKVAVHALGSKMNTATDANATSSGYGAFLGTLFGVKSLNVDGLSKTDGGKNIGGYGIRLDPSAFTVDGNKADLIARGKPGDEWESASKRDAGSFYSAFNKATYALSWAKPGTLEPIAFQTAAGKLGVQAYITKASELDLTKPVKLDGLTTLELVYL